MSSRWNLVELPSAPEELLPLTGGNSVVASLLTQRGYDTADKALPFIDPSRYTPAPARSLYGLTNAAETLINEIDRGGNLLVWGDFDVDGQTSTALLVSALTRLTSRDRVRYHVPNRFDEGHGIRLHKLQEILSDPGFRPDCIITCDTGISDGESIGYAKERGLTVIVTDHHDPAPELIDMAISGQPIWGVESTAAGGQDLLRADAIVNPKFQTKGDPLRTLPGVGVTYKLVEYVYACLGHAGEEEDLLDLAALGIVADVAEQTGDTRYLLQLGMRQLQRTRRIGLLALMNVAKLTPQSVDTESIGFQLGPRMNALGRLEDASAAVELLTTDDPILASQLAQKMDRLNEQRRLLTSQITNSAMTMLERRPEFLDFDAIVLGHASWHPGIVGIVASKIVEEFGKPAVLLVMPEDAPSRGSARSIPSVDIGASIAGCSELLLQYGGHPGAAGVTLLRENVDRFRHALHAQIAKHAISGAPEGLTIDAVLPFEQLTMNLAEQLDKLAPFGQGNPKPVFAASSVRINSDLRFGRQSIHRRLKIANNDEVNLELVWFNGADAALPPEPLDIAFTVGVNEYRGQRSLQLTYVDSRRARTHVAIISPDAVPAMHVVDLRRRDIDAASLPQPPQTVWYAEGMLLASDNGSPPESPRHLLRQSGAKNLILWSAPPSPELMQWMLEATEPDELTLCSRITADDSLAHLVRQIAGMCKYSIDKGLAHTGEVNLERMAARLGTTETVIRLGLQWLDARGVIKLVQWGERNALRVELGDGVVNASVSAELQSDLEAALAEIRAYRRFHQRASLASLGLPECQIA